MLLSSSNFCLGRLSFDADWTTAMCIGYTGSALEEDKCFPCTADLVRGLFGWMKLGLQGHEIWSGVTETSGG